MKIKITKELRDIFQEILKQDKSVDEWAEIESDDMFQTLHFIGGFDATESAFCFSFYDEHGKEYWFQRTLGELRQDLEQNSDEIEGRPAVMPPS